MTVHLADSTVLTIDDGAEAFSTLNARASSDAAPPATLRGAPIPAELLASTIDANTADPYIQEQAARLDYDPQRIIDFLQDDVGYESYVGSLRGARGTLWSSAGHALDEASLGVALFRASGIPAQYAAGTLSDPLAQQLILSMFPESYQTVGYIPAGTATADPANDPQLLSETRQHYWIQFDATDDGVNNPLDIDTSFPTSAVGQTFTATSSTFAAVPDSLRHKVVWHRRRPGNARGAERNFFDG
jgi:transglutaminase-like putative cysteine protease